MIPYSLHVAIILSVCLFFYKLLLQRQTYYRLNRLVLLSCLLLAFLLPLIPVPQRYSLLNAGQPVNSAVQQPGQPAVNTVTPPIATAANQTVVQRPITPDALPNIFNKQTLINWTIALYWFGVGAFALNFLVQIVVLLYQSYTKPAIEDGIYRIVEMDADKAPCSFGHHIFINPAKYDWETYNRILLHEKIHIKERHSIDLILAELVLVLQWFNPFAWLYRKDVENNLEFLTDDAILRQHHVDAQAYQWSLLQVAVPNYAMRVTTGYNQSRLKKRILMMDAKRSDVHTLWKYFMLMPLLALLVCGLNKPIAISRPITPAFASSGNNARDAATPDTNIDEKHSMRGTNDPGKITGRSHKGLVAHDSTTARFTTEQMRYLEEHQVTKAYIASFANMGFRPLDVEGYCSLKRTGVTAEYVADILALGFKNIPLRYFLPLKRQNIKPEYISGFQKIGFVDIPLSVFPRLKGMGITPEYVTAARKEGTVSNDINKYIRLKMTSPAGSQ